MARNQSAGFTLIEVLIVVAVIGIIAAIALPGLLRAKSVAAEASAIASLRGISTAQVAFAASCAGGSYAATLPILATPPANGGAYIGPDIGYAVTVVKTEYEITMASTSGINPNSPATCNGQGAGTSMSGFYATATPLMPGRRAFGVNLNGTVFWALQPNPLAMTDTTAPGGARAIPH